MKKTREISISDTLKIKRPVLGDNLPIAFWRLLRLIAIPKVFNKDTSKINRKIGIELGRVLAVKNPEDILDAIINAQIGVPNPLEKKDGNYAIEFTECVTCSGITPPVGEAICDLEVGIIEGAFEKIGMHVADAQETKCIGGLGDKVCRIEVKIQA